MRSKREQQIIANRLLKMPKGKLEPVDLSKTNPPPWMTRCFRNNRYTVMINDNAPMTGGITAIRAMIQRHDNEPIYNHWREMQSIKNEIFGCNTTAIEYYPSERELEDVANIYWLWIIPKDALPIPILRS